MPSEGNRIAGSSCYDPRCTPDEFPLPAQRGYRVTVAPTPGEALRVSDAMLGSVDLLLSDVVMPGIRGPELVGALRERRLDLRALFMTGYVDPAIESSATVGRYLLKPFQPAHLLERVAEELD